MLDKLPIGEKLKNRKLKCELCGLSFDADNELEALDFDKIEETGRCFDCFEEWGDNYPDRI